MSHSAFNAITKRPVSDVVNKDVMALWWEIPSDSTLVFLLSLSVILRNSAVVGLKLDNCCPSSPVVVPMLGGDVWALLGVELGYAEPEGTELGYAEPEGTELGSALDKLPGGPEPLGEMLGSTLSPSPLESSPGLVGSNKGMLLEGDPSSPALDGFIDGILLEGVPSKTVSLGVTEGSRLGKVISDFVLGAELLIVGVADAEDVGVAE